MWPHHLVDTSVRLYYVNAFSFIPAALILDQITNLKWPLHKSTPARDATS